MQKIVKGNKFTSIFLVVALLIGLLIGCSNSTTVSAKVNEKLELAVKYLSENNYEEAIITYQSAIKIDSKNVTAYKGLSLAYQLDNKMDLAEKALDDGLKAVPQTPQLKIALAGLMLDQGKADEAEVIYKELVSGDSPTLPAFQAYTYYLNKQGKQAEAIALLEQAVAKNTTEYKLNAMLAELFYKNGDQEKALAAINKSLTSQVDQSISYQLLTEMYQDKWADLIALGDQYIKQDQTQAGQLLKLSGLFSMGRYDDVIKQYGELTSDLKNNARTRLIVAQAYLKLNKKEQSSELLKTIKVAELKDAGMLADLAAFYLEIGDKDNARKLAVQGIGADESIIANYLVMYRSYEGEDKKLGQVWAYKYLLSSLLSYRESFGALAGAGIDLEQSKGRVTGKTDIRDRIKRIIYTPELVEEQISEGITYTHNTLNCYLDTSKDIAYYSYLVSQEDPNEANLFGKSIVARVHNPIICPISAIPPDEKKYNIISRRGATDYKATKAMKFNTHSFRNSNSDYYFPVIMEGNDFEGDLIKAGIPQGFIMYVDK